MADLKISQLTDYSPAQDLDVLPIVDNSTSTTKKISWANLKTTLAGTFLSSVTAHNILSATHGDTLADTVVRGDILYGNATPNWARLAFPATPTGKVIQATATDVGWSSSALGTAAFTDSSAYLAAGGTAVKATILATARNLWGNSFDGSADITAALTIGVASGSTGAINFKGTTSGTVTLSVLDAAGTWTMKLPNTAGSNGNFLKTDGSGNLSWASGGTGDMILASVQTNTGAKTFNSNTLWDKGNMVFNVKAYGAVADDSTDDRAAIQAAIDAAAAVGGIVWFPAGTYKIITSPLKLYSGTTPTIVAYSNITIAGAGSSGTGGSIIKQYTTGVDVIKGLNDVANGAQSQNVTIQDINLLFGGATLTNSGNGLYLAQQGANGPSFQLFNLKNVVATNCQGSGKYGFNIESIITSTVDTCMAVTCANGFYINGSAGGSYNSVNTSTTLLNCYANMGTNGVKGYNILDNTYINLVGCACDYSVNSAGPAYLIDGSNSVSLTSCACELDGTHTLTNMFEFNNGAAQCSILSCYGYQGKTGNYIYATGSTLGLTIIGFQVNSNVSGTTGLKIDSGSDASSINSDFSTANTPLTNAGTYSSLATGVVQASYKSSDGTAGLTQVSTTTSGKSITVKNGLITAFA